VPNVSNVGKRDVKAGSATTSDDKEQAGISAGSFPIRSC
jgi:hypothetical protein